MAHKRKRIFDGLYAQLEETDGNVVLFSARGEPSVIFEITLYFIVNHHSTNCS